jgi:quinol monooxygenase YgiN
MSEDAPACYTVTYVEVVPPSSAEAAALLRRYGAAVRKDPGNLRVEVLQRVDRPNQLTVLATWKNQAAFEAHGATTQARALRDALTPFLASPNDERLHHALSVGGAPAPSADGASASGADGAVYAVTHVDVIPPRKDDAVVALGQLAEDSRRDAGHVRFDVVQQTNRANHFTVVEVWKDRAAFDAHGMAAHTRRFRGLLTPMSGSLYDERLYSALT